MRISRCLGLPLLVTLLMTAGGCGSDDDGGGVYIIDLDGVDESEINPANSISGQVFMPEGTSSGHAMQFTVFRSSSPPVFVIEPVGTTNSSGIFQFRIANMADGDYELGMRVDLDDSGVFDTGDLEGYYDGTVESPILDRDLAATVTVAGGPVENADFGVGIAVVE